MNALAKAAAELFDAIEDTMGIDITFDCDAGAVGLRATMGKSAMVAQDRDNVVIQTVSHDFIVRAADLSIGGVPVTPRKGNTITREACGQTLTYQLMTPPYDPVDATGVMLRLHSKQIA